jgi:hypothetical protein
MKSYGGGYPLGTKVQHRNGYIKVKIEGEDGFRWEAESRRIWELYKGQKDPLVEGDRVFHVDGDRTNNQISNLAKIHYNQVKFVFLKESKVLFMPKNVKPSRDPLPAKHKVAA